MCVCMRLTSNLLRPRTQRYRGNAGTGERRKGRRADSAENVDAAFPSQIKLLRFSWGADALPRGL